MDKLKVLMAICETPGWQPPEDSSSIDRSLEELQREGWIIPRLDGYEATPEALDAFPYFGYAQAVGSDANVVIAASRPAETNGNGAHPEHGYVPLGSVTTMIAAMLQDLPITQVFAYASATERQLPPTPEIWAVARGLAEKIR